jgi:hypothetical protein
MKRKTTSKLPTSPVKTRTIAAHRLSAVRGGLGIDVEVTTPTPSLFHMQQQHNEVMIRL